MKERVCGRVKEKERLEGSGREEEGESGKQRNVCGGCMKEGDRGRKEEGSE